jgi:predicted nucleic acid-binding protein
VKTTRVLDAFALLAYLGGEPGHQRVKDLLESGSADLVMNDINVGEVYYSIARKRGLREAEYFLNVILPSLPVRVLDNSFDQVIEAARLKAGLAVSFADCFAAATALRERAILVTGDPDFRKFGRPLEIDWLV